LKPAKLAPISPSFIHGAIFIAKADIFCILLNSPLEETFAAFTGSDSVMLAGGVVSAYGT
jgi:hypothetical protein